MKMNLSAQQIDEIAENLDIGLKCYYNLKTGEIKTMLNFDSWESDDQEPWEEEINEIEENWSDYFQFEGMESHDSFQIMADFVDTLDDQRLKDILINALNKRKPFQHFKYEIDGSGEYRQQWFDFKKLRYIDWIKDQIDAHNDFEEHV
jgi:hypothetical protein